MSKALVAKIRKARERVVEVAGHKYIVARPTDEEAMLQDGKHPLDSVRKFVTGWDLQEIDLIPGGSPEPVPFTPELWAEYIADHPELWEPLGMAAIAGYNEHVKARGSAEKN
jgi:hypothetical protein